MSLPIYQIRVRGLLDSHWAEWFGEMSITHEAHDETVLSGTVADQAALYGLLARMRNLGLTLLAVKRLEDRRPKESNDG